MSNIPELKKYRYPKPLTVKVENETHKLFSDIKKKGKDSPEIWRRAGLQALEKVWKEVQHLPDIEEETA